MTSIPSSVILSARPSKAMDGALVQLRWLLAALAWLVFIITTESIVPSELFLGWLGILVVFNLLLMVALRGKNIPRRLPIWGLAGDVLLFGTLPYLGTTNTPVLFLFALFPTMVGALRLGPAAGILTGTALAVLYGFRSIISFLPASIQQVLPVSPVSDVNLVSAALPIVALFAIIFLVGYLAQREREAVIGDTAVELDQLRQGMEGAKLFFKTADTLSQTLSYSRVLDAMLEAGTNGMPTARREDGPAVGVVLFFEANDPEKTLRVVAWRHLDRTDTQRRIPGKEGIVAQTLEAGERVTFTDINNDPELREFTTFRRCRAGVCYPLQSGLDLYGVVLLVSPTPRLPAEQHLDLMKAFTNQAAVAFQNARLYQSLREERDRIIDTEANARAKLARDLHDGPTQSVSALAMRLEFISALLDREPDKAKVEIGQARESAIRTGKELRELLFALRPLTLETQGLSATLDLWAQRMQETEKVPLAMNAGDFGLELDVKLAGTVFSIIEEAVNNARKHGEGARIEVQVCKQGENLVATIKDQGPGFDLAAVEKNYDQRGSLGLVNMRERARLIDGHLAIDSWPGRGTQVVLVVPLGGRGT